MIKTDFSPFIFCDSAPFTSELNQLGLENTISQCSLLHSQFDGVGGTHSGKNDGLNSCLWNCNVNYHKQQRRRDTT